jgi:hypothetical protein
MLLLKAEAQANMKDMSSIETSLSAELQVTSERKRLETGAGMSDCMKSPVAPCCTGPCLVDHGASNSGAPFILTLCLRSIDFIHRAATGTSCRGRSLRRELLSLLVCSHHHAAHAIAWTMHLFNNQCTHALNSSLGGLTSICQPA